MIPDASDKPEGRAAPASQSSLFGYFLLIFARQLAQDQLELAKIS